ncbi:MFS transporter, DHA2 family, multidrug resistance protein [Devosia sp. YR412]|uniref:MFS transporter n=1 Tax=Devosia sp. YR412 TaxID=1881030 RepID=UPI0008C81A28|nr:MFS transporter [Devosia sp. YR412]SEQ09364.1 MFS transporter, DHA2 family, multidrug resistance protein [Devosia sp. YR412]
MTLQDGLPNPQRLLAFATVAIVLFLAVLDEAVVNVALPLMAADLNAAPGDALWIINAYRLAVVMVLLPVAALGDSLGYRRVYLGGIALFTAASLICALAPSLEILVAARVLQGIGAAGIMGINIALVRFIFPQAMLGRAVGNVAVVVAVSSAAGPSLAGVILSIAPWPALFLVNLPIGVVAIIVGLKTLPVTQGSGRRIDIRSALFAAATFALLIIGVNTLADGGGLVWGLALIALAIALGALFARSQLKLAVPMLPVDLLQKPVFALSATTSMLAFAAYALALASLPFYLHDVLSLSPAETGLLMTPLPIATAIAATISGRLADRLPPGKLAAVGLTIFALGLALLAFLPVDATHPDIIWRMALTGFGFGIFQAPNNKVMIGSAPRARSGGAGAIQSTARLLGQSIGVALLAIVLGTGINGAFSIGLGIAAGLAVAGILPSALRTFQPAETPATPVSSD